MTTFDLSPLISAPAADVTDHVHLLRVTAQWFCQEGFCAGHDEAAEGREIELEYELEHPEACPIPACCCKWPEGPSFIDPNCSAGHHETCLNVDRCWTARDLAHEGLGTFEFPKVTATYRIQAWGSGPDYEGDYDGGIEFEAVASS